MNLKYSIFLVKENDPENIILCGILKVVWLMQMSCMHDFGNSGYRSKQ